MIDISDGLLADLGHILNLSGKGARIELTKLPLSPAFTAHMGESKQIPFRCRLPVAKTMSFCSLYLPKSILQSWRLWLHSPHR